MRPKYRQDLFVFLAFAAGLCIGAALTIIVWANLIEGYNIPSPPGIHTP